MMNLSISDLLKLRPKPGDLIVVTAGKPTTEEALTRLAGRVERALHRNGCTDVAAVALPHGSTLEQVEQGAKRRRPAAAAAVAEDPAPTPPAKSGGY